jgi:hypothetical protein
MIALASRRGLEQNDAGMRLLPALLALLPSLAPEAAAPPRASVAGLAWMAGDWFGGEGGAVSEEVWTEPSGDCMVGLWRFLSGGRLEVYESLALVADGDGVVMRLRHFGRDGVGWEEKDRPISLKLVSAGEREAVFEGPGRKDGETVRISYRRPAGDALVSVLEKWMPGQAPSRTEFRFKSKAAAP